MDSEDEHEGDHPSTEASLTGFLFGNIDEKGELEEDFLDEVNRSRPDYLLHYRWKKNIFD